jgi:hypothetical protein
VAALGSLERNFALYMTHHRVLVLRADNNVTENVIKQLAKKLRLMEGFPSLASPARYVRLLVGCYLVQALHRLLEGGARRGRHWRWQASISGSGTVCRSSSIDDRHEQN